MSCNVVVSWKVYLRESGVGLSPVSVRILIARIRPKSKSITNVQCYTPTEIPDIAERLLSASNYMQFKGGFPEVTF